MHIYIYVVENQRCFFPSMKQQENGRVGQSEKKFLHLSSWAKQCSPPSSHMCWESWGCLLWHWLTSSTLAQRSAGAIRLKSLPLWIFHPADVIVPQPSSVKMIQLIWALLIVEAFGFLFQPGWFWQTVELSGQGNGLHLDRWSFNARCYCCFCGGAAVLR